LESFAYKINFNDDDMSKLEDEVVNYQLLEDNCIQKHIWESAQVSGRHQESSTSSNVSFRMDNIWTQLSSLKSPDGCSFRLRRLCKK